MEFKERIENLIPRLALHLDTHHERSVSLSDKLSPKYGDTYSEDEKAKFQEEIDFCDGVTEIIDDTIYQLQKMLKD